MLYRDVDVVLRVSSWRTTLGELGCFVINLHKIIFWSYVFNFNLDPGGGFKSLNNPYWLYGIFIGGVGWGFGAILLLLGQKLSDPVTPTICAAMMPIFGAIVELFLIKEKLILILFWGLF